MRFPESAVIKEGEMYDVGEYHYVYKITLYPKVYGEAVKLSLDGKIIFLSYIDAPYIPSVRIIGTLTVDEGSAYLEYEMIEKGIECKHIYGFVDSHDYDDSASLIHDKDYKDFDVMFKYCPSCGIESRPNPLCGNCEELYDDTKDMFFLAQHNPLTVSRIPACKLHGPLSWDCNEKPERHAKCQKG